MPGEVGRKKGPPPAEHFGGPFNNAILPTRRYNFKGIRREKDKMKNRSAPFTRIIQQKGLPVHPTPFGQAFGRTAHKAGVKQDANLPLQKGLLPVRHALFLFKKQGIVPISLSYF